MSCGTGLGHTASLRTELNRVRARSFVTEELTVKARHSAGLLAAHPEFSLSLPFPRMSDIRGIASPTLRENQWIEPATTE
jgi:hypothetical protein